MTREEGVGVAVLLFAMSVLLLAVKTIIWFQLG